MRIVSLADRRESELQHAVMRFYETLGCQVVRFSEGRRTRITPGWPDLAVFCPAKRTMWYHEVKGVRGLQSPAQSSVQQLAESCGIAYLLGGVEVASEHLTRIGVIAP